MLLSLLTIKSYQVAEKLELSYHNIRGLHKKVDSVPPRAKWKTRELWYKSDPEDKHIIHYRDPKELISALLGNPAHAKDIVYRPKKVFTDSMKTSRIYNEMWTGEWWNTVQVSVFWSFLIYTSDLILLGFFTQGRHTSPCHYSH
jgi:Plavaka transposase